jgi:hypothetical protein
MPKQTLAVRQPESGQTAVGGKEVPQFNRSILLKQFPKVPL